MRNGGRRFDQLRPVSFETGFSPYAEGSCLVKFGNTHVLVTASVEDRLPQWRRGLKGGWLTAEYGMLPRATHQRTDREATRGQQTGRSQEIQRLIGRSLRAVTDLKALPEVTIKLDCDVLQADGGTRTAAITGAWLALHDCCQHLIRIRAIDQLPLIDHLTAISCGLVKGEARLDLDYDEDSNAEADANFVLTSKGGIVEIQATAEDRPFARERFIELLDLARQGCTELVRLQRETIMKGLKAA